MKLRNRKTGEIGYTAVLRSKAIFVVDENAIQLGRYDSLAELNEEWEDAPEEPKEYWYIGDSGEVWSFSNYYLGTEIEETHREIGNLFETKEEAEKAVEKLKAWKRLKDKGFEFCGWCEDIGFRFTKSGAWQTEVQPDLDLLFGGEE